MTDAQTSHKSAEEPTSASLHVRHARDSDGQRAESGLARQLSELARELQADQDTTSLLHHIVAATVAEVDGADHGGISLIEGTRAHTEAATDVLVERLDQRQYRFDGPCVASLREQITVRSEDLSKEERWPRFAVAAVAEGVLSMLSVQLFVEGDNLGALNLYAMTPNAFDSHDESTALAMAAHAAVAMKGRNTENNLRIALASRDIIGQAKGILMERFKIGADEAFTLLVMASQRTHRKLRAVAEELTATGELRAD